MTLQDERDKLFRKQNKSLTCIVIGCNKREVTPGFCAEHAEMVNAECDRLDAERGIRNMPISLFGWKTHRWILGAVAVLVATVSAVFHFASIASLMFTSAGVVAGIIFALLVRKWRELN